MASRAGRSLVVLSVVTVVLMSSSQLLTTSCHPNHNAHDPFPQAFQSRTYLALQDARPDLSLNPADFYITRNGNNVTSGMYGMQLEIFATFRNIGGSSANDVWLRIGFRNDTLHLNQTLFDQGYSYLDSNITNNSIEVSTSFFLGLVTTGGLDIWACVDILNLVNESIETNNFLALKFTIVPLQTDIVIYTDKTKYTPEEDIIIVTATIHYAGTNEPAHVLISFYLVDESGDAVPDTETAQTSSDYQGYAGAAILIPPHIKNGMYNIGVKVLDEPQVSSTSVEISKPDPRIVLVEALAIAILVIAAVVATILLALKWRDSRGRR